MNIRRFFIPVLLLAIPLLFFYKTIIFQKVPFPGDLLLGNYEPYKSDTDLGFALGGIPNKGQGADVIRELYPWKYFTIQSLKQGEFPLWNPYNFSGNPHFANLQSGALYPVNILFFVMPFIPAWSIYIILQFVFMFAFMYLYLREINLSKVSSLFGSIAFTFSGFITVWAEYGNLGHTLAYIPLVLFCIEKSLKKEKWYWYMLLIASLTFSVMAGYIQLTMYIYILALVYLVSRFFVSKKKNIRIYFFLVSCFIGAALLSAVQLIPILEFVKLSLRANYSYNVLLERLMPPESIITLLVPDFFGNPATMNYFLRGGSSLERAASIGVWPLIFTVFAVFSKKTFYKNFFLLSAIIIYISTLSIPPIALFHSIGIPFLSTGIPTRALSIFCFCAAVLAAIGLDAFLHSKEKRKLLITSVVFLFLFITLWISTYVIHNPLFLISRHNLILPTGIFIFGLILILIKIPKKITAAIILVLTILELFYAFQKFNSFVPKEYVYPQTHIVSKLRQIQGTDRYWGYGNANIDTNFQLIDKNYSTDGYDALFSKRYGEFLSASENGRVSVEVPRSVANIFKGYGVNDLKKNPNRTRALDLTGVKYVLNKSGNPGIDSAMDEKRFKLLWEGNSWQIYENKNVLSRMTLFGKYKIESNSGKIIKSLYDPKFDFHSTLILEEPLPSGYNIQPGLRNSIKNISYSPNKIYLKTNSSKDQLLFISDNYFPGWKAMVDGKDTQILRANYTFRAVPIKRGTHQVVFTYSPASFWIGLWISVVSFISLIVIFVSITMVKHVKKT